MIIDAKTKFAGLIGHKINYTLSPTMHNAGFNALGLNIVYLAFDIKPEDFGKAIDGLRALGVLGFNITIPYKEQIIPYLNSLSDDAKLIGAVNTVVNDDGKLNGYNTDGIGFLASLNNFGITLSGISVTLIGTGGAGRAVACMLAKAGVGRICLSDKMIERSELLKTEILMKFKGIEVITGSLEHIERWLKDTTLLINATPIGMKSVDPLLVNPDLLRGDMVVYDLIYTPTQTPLLKNAVEKGAKVLNGLEMLVNQGAAAFEIWTGESAPVELMRQAALSRIKIMGNSSDPP